MLDFADSPDFSKMLFSSFARTDTSQVYDTDCMLLYRKGPNTRVECNLGDQDISEKIRNQASVLPTDLHLSFVFWNDVGESVHRFIFKRSRDNACRWFYTEGTEFLCLNIVNFVECRLYYNSDASN